MAPNSPFASPLIPSEKYRTSGLPLLPPTPKSIPEAASPLSARVDRDRAVKLPVARDKGIDLAMEEAEVADQHIIAEPAETGRCDGNRRETGCRCARSPFANHSKCRIA